MRTSLLLLSLICVTGLTHGAGATATTDSGRAQRLEQQSDFEALSYRNSKGNVVGVQQVKFLITDPLDDPEIWFFDSKRFRSHYGFAKRGLRHTISALEFHQRSRFTLRPDYLACSLVRHSHRKEGRDIYTVDFRSADPVTADNVILAYRLVLEHAPFLGGELRYHPTGLTQEQLFESYRDKLSEAKVKTIFNSELYRERKFILLNAGRGVGTLRIISGNEIEKRPATVRDIVILTTVPNDLGHVAGIISEEPQTPLSHVNLIAMQNRIPNCYVGDASTKFKKFEGKLVSYAATPDGCTVKEASQEEADAYWKSRRPKKSVSPQRDLSVRSISPLGKIGLKDRFAFGMKTAQLGELRRADLAEHSVRVPDGFGVPFAHYHEFMVANKLYAAARAMITEEFLGDAAMRRAKLSAFRQAILSATVPAELSAQLAAMWGQFPAGSPVRCRSSTNNEDLVGFNGAGLYESRTHRKDEGVVDNTIRQVWAGLWTLRAFDEREFHRVDHFQTAMGVLVHPNFDDEKANGVIVTRNLASPGSGGIYVNVQQGEAREVANPTDGGVGALPDVFVVTESGQFGAPEIIYLQRSLSGAERATVLTTTQVLNLFHGAIEVHEVMNRAHGVFDGAGRKELAFDIEFKVDQEGKLFFKQARPWVD